MSSTSMYTVEFRYVEIKVHASDTDMAVIKAEEICMLPVEDRGELMSIEIDGQKFYSHAGHVEMGAFAPEETPALAKPKLPSRRAAGLTLSYDDGDLYVNSFGYSASITCASNVGELMWHGRGCREEKMLSDKQMAIVHEWDMLQDEYYEANGWKTWGELNDEIR